MVSVTQETKIYSPFRRNLQICTSGLILSFGVTSALIKGTKVSTWVLHYGGYFKLLVHTFLFPPWFLVLPTCFLQPNLIFYKKEAVKTRKFSFSVPPASPGTNPPVSSSQTQPQVPHWPRRRFSSPNPAAWDHISQVMHHSTPQSKHKGCVHLNTSSWFRIVTHFQPFLHGRQVKPQSASELYT